MKVTVQQINQSKILVADNETDVLDLVCPCLASVGYTIVKAHDGREALEKIRSERPDLVLLEVNMPVMSGFDVCRVLKSRAETSQIPLIILTTMTAEVDRIVALEIGADDYVTKPFSPRELVLRVKAVLRRCQGNNSLPEVKQVGNLLLDTVRYSVELKGRKLRLTPIEFKLLEALIDHQGHLQSRETLLQNVWSGDTSITARTVDTHIQRLREKLGTAGRWIETVRGKGYKIIESGR
ncbi:MAG: response regulator transcription factor [Verrucomicrobiota bacterium]